MRIARGSRAVAAALAGVLLAAALTAPAPAAPAVALHADRALETVRGPARTAPLPGGGYLSVFAFGAVVRHGAGGGTVWQRDSQSLYRDWRVAWPTQGYVEQPQLPWGSNPFDPLEFAGAGADMIGDTHPYAVGDLTGDGVPDVAVADVVGVNTSSASSCGLCRWPFTVPGSDLHLGTFVTVLDGRTGRTLYSELDPGYVTQLAVAGGRLVIGDETGDPQQNGGIGQWGSVTTVRAVVLHRAGSGLAASTAWRFSTGSPWGRLLDLTPAAGGIGVAWSDTPEGLGVTGPPDGHVVLLDGRGGAPRWDTRTAGYPVLLAADPGRGELACVQVTDPFRAIGYDTTGLALRDGRAVVSVRRAGSQPLALAVSRAGWVVGATDGTYSAYPYPHLAVTAGRVGLVDPDRGRERWSVVLPAASPQVVPEPGGLVATGGSVVVGAWTGATSPTEADPAEQSTSLFGLDGGGRLRWQQASASAGDGADPVDPLSLSAGAAGTVRGVTGHQVVRTVRASDGHAAGTTAEAGDILSTTVAAGRLVAGDESGAVYALDAAALAGGTASVRWRVTLGGPVQRLSAATVDGRPVVVAVATTSVAVLDAASGRIRAVARPAGYLWTSALATAGREPAVLVPDATGLGAYSLRTGRPLWQWVAPAGAAVSTPAAADGTVAVEYGGTTAAVPLGAVGLDTATGRPRWNAPADPATTTRAQLWNGTVTDPAIPGAAGRGVALAWQATAGQGRVEVRDITTGALDYADSSPDLQLHTGFLTDPGVGLVAVSQRGAVRVTPTGADANPAMGGMSVALLPGTPAGDLVLTAGAGIEAYPTGALGDDTVDSVAGDWTYNPGTVSVVDLAGQRRAVTTPVNWLAYRVVNGAAGTTIGRYQETLQHGLAVLSVTAATGSARQPDTARSSTARPDAPALPGTTAAATAAPAGTGAPEPARSGTASPAAVPAASPAAVAAYTPAQVHAYLGPTGDGSGQTVAIVDAYHDPSLTADVAAFSQRFGLPGVCGAGGATGDCFTLDVQAPDGTGGTDAGWALETALDVEWAHAIAPRARILLVEAPDSTFAALFAAVDAATAAHPAAVSLSWGTGYEFSDETYYDRHCAVTTTVCVAASGDDGHPGSYPAYAPSVLAVGGTTLQLDATGTVTGETSWSGSGGGRSWVEPQPAPQHGAVADTRRHLPDVSFDANPATGVAVYDSVTLDGHTGWFQVGGTSLGAPAWSALLAGADQLRAAAGAAPLTAADQAAQRAVYGLPAGALADITTGPANGFCPAGCTPTTGFDDVTGLGSPRTGIETALAGWVPT